MAMQQCRWCAVAKNGYTRIAEHERENHTRQYFLDLADKLEAQAAKDIERAKHLRDRWGL